MGTDDTSSSSKTCGTKDQDDEILQFARQVIKDDNGDTMFVIRSLDRLVVRDQKGNIVKPIKLNSDDLHKQLKCTEIMSTATITMTIFKKNPCYRLIQFGGDCWWEEIPC